MELQEWVKKLPAFKNMTVVNKMLAIGYFFHTEKGKEKFVVGNITIAFEELHLPKPTAATSQLNALTTGMNKRLLHDAKGYKLTANAREAIAKLLPAVQTPKQIIADLKALEQLITDAQQKVFLHEALVCFTHEAYRASIVMAWNLAYHHVLSFVFNHKLAEFNAQMKSQFPKDTLVVKAFTDFEEIREGKVLLIIKNAGIVSAATSKTLKAKLDIRNTAAHPSSTIVAPVTAEEVITDLVKNILLRPVL